MTFFLLYYSSPYRAGDGVKTFYCINTLLKPQVTNAKTDVLIIYNSIPLSLGYYRVRVIGDDRCSVQKKQNRNPSATSAGQ